MRAMVLSALVGVAVVSMLIGLPAQPVTSADLPTLTYVTTAQQFGVVGYRDPVGAISPDGKRFAYTEGRFLRVVPVGGGVSLTLAPGDRQIRNFEWLDDESLAVQDGAWWLYRLGQPGRALRAAPQPNPGRGCLANRRLTVPCGGPPVKLDIDRDVYGPIAFSPDGNTVYFSTPNDRGMVELWSANLTTGRSRRLTNFSRDAYAPSVAADGTVVFKTQSYRTHLADVAMAGGPSRQLTTFQSETPSYHPSKPLIAFTYGTWRRVVDDAKYPDIAQEIGVIDVSGAVPASQPSHVVAQSDSEDQAMAWSPNGKWIAFHTHREMSDDIWLKPADLSQPELSAAASAKADRRITFLGRGAEVGWPRWSPDGKTVLLNGARKGDGASVLYTIGVDQESGATTSELREIRVEGVTGEMGHAEWLPDSATVIALVKEGPGRHAIIRVPAAGGRAAVEHRFESEHDFSGLGVSSNGRFVAFAAPAPDGYFQIFTKALGHATPAVQLTTDPSHKTQPAFSPDGARVAFTVWSYEAAFWSFKER